MPRLAITAAVLAVLALAGCGDDPAAVTGEAARVMLVDPLGEIREPIEDGYQNSLTIEDEAGERVSERDWHPITDADRLDNTDIVELDPGTYRIRAEARDYFASEHGKLEEHCEVEVEVDAEPVVWIERHWGNRCQIELDLQLCPTLGEKDGEAALHERAELALLGMPFEEAETLAAAVGCHVVAAQIDGEPRPLTREYDPTRIAVQVHDGEVRKIVGFG